MAFLGRRAFLGSGIGAGAATALTGPQASAQARTPTTVSLSGDGVSLTPREYAQLLTTITADEKFSKDTYLKGGAVEELEARFASVLGKESAVFLPTGTLANHLAVRILAGEKRRVLVQAESHLYRDEDDCAQLLSGLNLVALGAGKTTLKADEVIGAIEQSTSGPYPVAVGAISIESPVRRTRGGIFDFDQMQKITAYARTHGIGTHLDGARMFLASGYSAISPARYSELFDTVYVSLYKYFNAPFGAILAGKRAQMEKVAALRHPFGSALWQGWESAAVALHFLNGFSDRYARAVSSGNALLRALEADERFRVERVPDGSNVFGFKLASAAELDAFRAKLAQANILMNAPRKATQTTISINETLNRRAPEEIAREFVKAAG